MKVSQVSPSFQPVSITLSTPTELADFIGALGAYGKGKVKAKKTIREAGLEEFYSGNARKTARNIVTAVVEAAGLTQPDFGAASIDESAVDEALAE